MKKKSQRSYFFFFCWLSIFCILPSGLFASEAEKKIRFFFFRLICHIFPPQCVCMCLCECASARVCFHACTLDLKKPRLIWMPICQTHQSVNSVFPIFFSSCPLFFSPLWRFWHINMYRQAGILTPANTTQTQPTPNTADTHICPLKTCDQPDPIPCNHLEPPHTQVLGPLQSWVMVWGRGLKRRASFP